MARDSNENAASSSQVEQPDANPSSSAVKRVAETTKNLVGTRLSHQIMTISPNYVGHLERVHSNVRRKLGHQPHDDMVQIDVNMVIWGIFMSDTLTAVLHLGQD